MELWIRSQDREKLIKVSNIQYYHKNCPYGGVGNHYIGAYFDNLNILAEYKTRTRALEVLDEIQKYLINNTFAKKMNGLGETLDLIPNSIFVYEMPKE